ncbi:DUF2254 domain-containing protein [Streptomyces beijiangensis]|uniref:DUF2254 domain-containing protein n=1 Tax=Streptomyces beijiangensis TaxID=163361 RepID=A0A939F519_9ACTN|nr:DUF2254 domain-containing protein [Streptomyces beijiangensis]MBO0512706.1 DUF2254 domain-containing protein [Streptomyces beijiangensis]
MSDTISAYRRPRLLSPVREHLRDNFWFAPMAAMVLVMLAWLAASALDSEVVRQLQADGDFDQLSELVNVTEDIKPVISTVSSAMMTFIGVVFSISLVAVQMASGQFSPRVVRIFVRSRITKSTFAVFLATFVLSLAVLSSYESETDPRLIGTVPLVQSLLTLVMVALSLLLFVAYVNATLRLMRVGQVVERIAGEAFRTLERQPGAWDPEWELPAESGVVRYAGRAGVLRDVNIARLVLVARRHSLVVRLIPRIGDFVVPGAPLLAVHGGDVPGRASMTVRSSVSVAAERTFHQDLGFGLRQLADIALRALSPAVNDPTTAVQCLDRIMQLLAAVVSQPLGAVQHRDAKGVVRLVQPVPEWNDLVNLGLAEVRGCAVGSPQVTRRLMAVLDDLAALAPEGRVEVLAHHRELLVRAVERAVPEAADRVFALSPDHQGIG